MNRKIVIENQLHQFYYQLIQFKIKFIFPMIKFENQRPLRSELTT